MAFVITEPCIGTKDGNCRTVCPKDCIFEADDQFYIDPEECIDCAACVSACPVGAIFHQDDLPPNWQSYLEKNARLAQR
jgi:ferredoxin